MINKYFKKMLISASIAMLIMTSILPSISSSPEFIENKENTNFKDDFYCEITKPTRGLYLNNEFIRDFIFIRRGIVIGDLTFEATAVDDVNGIEKVVFHVVGGWNNLQLTATEEPFRANWTKWGPGIYHITATAYNNLNETVESINDIQIFKLG